MHNMKHAIAISMKAGEKHFDVISHVCQWPACNGLCAIKATLCTMGGAIGGVRVNMLLSMRITISSATRSYTSV